MKVNHRFSIKRSTVSGSGNHCGPIPKTTIGPATHQTATQTWTARRVASPPAIAGVICRRTRLVDLELGLPNQHFTQLRDLLAATHREVGFAATFAAQLA